MKLDRLSVPPLLFFFLIVNDITYAEEPETLPSSTSSPSTIPQELMPSSLLPSEEARTSQTKSSSLANSFEGFGSGMGGMGRGTPGGSGPFQLSGTWFPQQSITSQPYSLGLSTAGMRTGIPIWRVEGSMVLFTTAIQGTWFDISGTEGAGPLRLAKTGQRFPDEVYNVTFGTLLTKKFDNGWMGALGFNFGSASDKPFYSVRELTFGTYAMLRIPLERDAWQFSLMYSPTSQLWFPVPGLAYIWKPSEEWTVNIGLPFSVRWRPTEDWQFDFSYIPITNINAKLTHRLGEDASIYLGYFARNESYLLANRVDYQDRFMIFDQRIGLGISIPLGKYLQAEVNGGYAFGRYFYEGQSSVADEHRLYIGSGGFIGAQLQAKY